MADMTRDQALDVVTTAADSWSRELTDYIIPDTENSEDPGEIETTENRRKQVDDIDEAIQVLSAPVYSIAIDTAIEESVTAQLRIVKELGGDPLEVVVAALKNHGLWFAMKQRTRNDRP